MSARRRLAAYLASHHPESAIRLWKHRRFAGFIAKVEILTPEGFLIVESGCSTKPADCYRDCLAYLEEDEATFSGFDRSIG